MKQGKKILVETYEPKKNFYQFPSEVLKQEGLTNEVVSKRMVNSKTYKTGDHRFTIINSQAVCHYREDFFDTNEQWKEIDLTIKDEGTHYSVDKAPYRLTIPKDKIGYSYLSRKGSKIDVELTDVADSPNFDVAPTVNGNVLAWRNVASGLHLKLVLRPTFVEIFK